MTSEILPSSVSVDDLDPVVSNIILQFQKLNPIEQLYFLETYLQDHDSEPAAQLYETIYTRVADEIRRMPIESAEIHQAFDEVIEENWPNASIGKKPTRVEALRHAFTGKENSRLTIDDFLPHFNGDANHQRKNALNAISWFDGQLRRLELNLEIESIFEPEDQKRYYFFRRP